MKDLRNTLSVGTSCGQCASCAKSLLKEYLMPAADLKLQAI